MTKHQNDEIKPADERILAKYGKKTKNNQRAVVKVARTNKAHIKYDHSFPEVAFKICLLFGATDEKLAKFFDVTRETIDKWKRRYPEFATALKEGKAIADANVAQAVYMAAIGYERDEIDLKVVSLGEGQGSVVEKVEVKRYYPPNIKAATFWLTNRQPENWTLKVEQPANQILNVIKIGYGAEGNTT